MPARDKRPTRVCTHMSKSDLGRVLTRDFETSIFRVIFLGCGVLKYSVMYRLGEGRRRLRPEADYAVDTILSYSLYRIVCKLRYAIILYTCSGKNVLRPVIPGQILDVWAFLSLVHVCKRFAVCLEQSIRKRSDLWSVPKEGAADVSRPYNR